MSRWIGRIILMMAAATGHNAAGQENKYPKAGVEKDVQEFPDFLPASGLKKQTELLPQPNPEIKGGSAKEIAPIQPFDLQPFPAPHFDTPSVSKPKILNLTDVLASVELHYPLLIASFQERGIADGKVLSARGAFDLNLDGFTRWNQGSFDSQRYNLGLFQPLSHSGIDVYGGYRIGAGSYPSYYGDRQTAEGGEFRLGLNIPLLKDRDIDLRRTGVLTQSLERGLAEPTIMGQRLLFQQSAAQAYWIWVATAKRFVIAQKLLNIAEERETFLIKRLKAGAEARIEVIDNRRLIVDRRTKLLTFRRAYEQASIDLSLFLRDEQGHPKRPDIHWQPADFPEPIQPDVSQLTKDIQLALQQRPELAGLNLKRQKLEAELQLANNQLLPTVDVVVFGAQDVGNEKKSLDRYRYEAGLLMNVPLQRRVARGTILTLKAKIAQISAKQQFATDRIAAEVQNVVSALVRAYEMREQAKQTVELTRELEEAEVKKRDLGKSNILFVNLRELARAEAELQEVDAFLTFYRALADYYAVLGTNTSPLKQSPKQ